MEGHGLRLVTTIPTSARETFDGLTTVAFMELCYRRGLSFTDNGQVLSAGPNRLLTPEIVEEIKKRKPVILWWLRSEMARGVGCIVCGWQGDTWNGWCEICIDPAFIARMNGKELIRVRV